MRGAALGAPAWTLALLMVPVLVLGLAGCERSMRDMYDQPRLGPEAGSPQFADGRGTRPPPPGSLPVAMGDLAFTSSGRRGRTELAAQQAAAVAAGAPPVDAALLARGRERYDIFCAPCHSVAGDGDGLVARRGFPHPPSFHDARLRAVDDRHIVDVIDAGYGVMPAYGDRVSATDRWAIAAWVRTLQLSRAAPVAELPPALRAALQALPAPAAGASAASVPPPRASNPETAG